MAKELKTTKKRPAKPFTGVEGVTFSKDYQPAPEAKKEGWEDWRKKRLLTTSVITEMLGIDGKPTESLKSYVQSLIKNAKAGNPKAIDAVNKCLEDDVMKIEVAGKFALLNIDPLSDVE